MDFQPQNDESQVYEFKSYISKYKKNSVVLIICILQYLPVYTPNEEEKKDAKLYAANVRRVMAKYVEHFKFLNIS